MSFLGVQWLASGLHLLTQGLLIPVFLLLFYAVIAILVDLGILFREMYVRKRDPLLRLDELYDAASSKQIIQGQGGGLGITRYVFANLHELTQHSKEKQQIYVRRRLEKAEERVQSRCPHSFWYTWNTRTVAWKRKRSFCRRLAHAIGTGSTSTLSIHYGQYR